MYNDITDKNNIEILSVNTIRILTIDAVQNANSGHPGAPMGLASVGYVLWTRIMKHNPKNPDWQNRDRFVLSCGHASMLLYSLLYLTGYDLSIDDIKNFRTIGSKTPGHPEYGKTPGVETTTGPLGQGISNAVGMAMAERNLATKFNKPGYDIVDHYTYVICGDGDLMEGISYESASIAGHFGLSKLICIYDSNGISIEGSVDITFTEDVVKRFESCGWHVLIVEKEDSLDDIEQAIILAKSEKKKPSILIVKTSIAFGSPNYQDSASSHGSPLGKKEVILTKRNFNWPENESFFVPKKVLSFCRRVIKNGINEESLWLNLYKRYSKKFTVLSNELLNCFTCFISESWCDNMPRFSKNDSHIETRTASGYAINYFSSILPTLIGGSADLAPSNKTYIKNSGDFGNGSYDGRNIHFGVREFSMGGILTGMFLHGGVRPYGGTFLVFSDYMRPAIRLASIMGLPIIYIFTHDSIAVGEDGPTHQPVEHLNSLRVIPGLILIRPADANETIQAWKIAILSKKNPVAMILSRQKLPILDFKKVSENVKYGAYIIDNSESNPEVVIISSGSEVHISLKAKKKLEVYGLYIRVISMPSWEIFDKQSNEYKERIIPTCTKCRVAVEAGSSIGWERYIGNNGIFIGIDEYGISGKGSYVMSEFGISVNNIVERILEYLLIKK